MVKMSQGTVEYSALAPEPREDDRHRDRTVGIVRTLAVLDDGSRKNVVRGVYMKIILL